MRYALLIFSIALLASLAFAEENIDVETLRLEHRFGLGLSLAGPLSAFGMEADINVNEVFSVAAGFGTGMDYSTVMVKGRYFLLGRWVNPYFGAGFARWWTDRSTVKGVKPSVLANRFLEPHANLTKGFSVSMVYPLVGVQYMHPTGFSVSAELQYLFKLFNFSNGTYAGFSVHWYI